MERVKLRSDELYDRGLAFAMTDIRTGAVHFLFRGGESYSLPSLRMDGSRPSRCLVTFYDGRWGLVAKIEDVRKAAAFQGIKATR